MRYRAAAAVGIIALGAASARADLRGSFLFTLADTSGTMPLSWAQLSWDARASELYVVDSHNGVVDIFNDAGIAVHAFGDDSALGVALGVAPQENGDLIVLVSKNGKPAVLRCNFRGDPIALIELKAPRGFEPGKDDFNPNFIASAQGLIQLADKASMKALVIKPDGSTVRSIDLKALLKVPAKKSHGLDIRGMSVSKSGDLLFTVSAMSLAYVLAPDGSLRSFGMRGSSPGKFNIAGGIATDDDGHYYVTDVLRAVVMVFDSDFKFLGEFGYRGQNPENLIAPNDIAVGNGRVYVSQSIGGVKAFGVRF